MYLNTEDITKGMRTEVLNIITRNNNEITRQAIIDAQAEVEAYLCARYDILGEFEKDADIDDRSQMVVKLVRSIAIYNCYIYSAPVNMPANVKDSYENSIKFLRDVQAEKASIIWLKRLTTEDGKVSSNYIYYTGESQKRQHHI
ncbi:MAG: DUF1320 domain-containing protein [Prevotellaceae bacterium]|jgi:phage gp36-like protein|nr:DUF1320 domain-containing protein [Prevotellaceae bacterium]